MMAALARELNGGYAFFERNWNLTRRYAAWEVVWLVYSETVYKCAAWTSRRVMSPIIAR